MICDCSSIVSEEAVTRTVHHRHNVASSRELRVRLIYVCQTCTWNLNWVLASLLSRNRHFLTISASSDAKIETHHYLFDAAFTILEMGQFKKVTVAENNGYKDIEQKEDSSHTLDGTKLDSWRWAGLTSRYLRDLNSSSISIYWFLPVYWSVFYLLPSRHPSQQRPSSTSVATSTTFLTHHGLSYHTCLAI